MENFPCFSIVTPTLNQGQYIKATVHSVMDQRYPDIEYIIIDGGSTDNTHKVLSELKAEYGDKLQFYIYEKMGQVAAINKGFSMTTGEIMAFINSDDVYLPGVFHAVSQNFNRNPNSKWLAGPTIIFDERSSDMKILFREKPLKDLVNWLHRNFTPQPSVFWRREAYNQFGGFDERYRYRFDHAYWLRFIEKGYDPIYLKCPLSAYRLHPDSLTCTAKDHFRRELDLIRKEWSTKLSYHEKSQLKKLIRRSEVEKMQTIALELAAKGYKRKAFQKWIESISFSFDALSKLMTYLVLRRIIFPRNS